MTGNRADRETIKIFITQPSIRPVFLFLPELTMNTTAITIDPGFNGTGWASWEAELWDDKTRGPINWGVMRTKKFKSLEERGYAYYEGALLLFSTIKPTVAYVEWPQFFASTGLGHTAAGRGDLGMVYFAASIIMAAAWVHDVAIYQITVRSWKGQLSKEQIAYRVSKALQCPMNKFPNHALDAVGIGLKLKGAI